MIENFKIDIQQGLQQLFEIKSSDEFAEELGGKFYTLQIQLSSPKYKIFIRFWSLQEIFLIEITHTFLTEVVKFFSRNETSCTPEKFCTELKIRFPHIITSMPSSYSENTIFVRV